MSEVPEELRDYVEPLVRVGHVTLSVYERCIQEALRLGLSEAEGDAYLRELAEEHDALLEAPPRPEFAATAAWIPPEGAESEEDDPTKADVLEHVPSDSEERRALEAATGPTQDGFEDEVEAAGADEVPQVGVTAVDTTPPGIPTPPEAEEPGQPPTKTEAIRISDVQSQLGGDTKTHEIVRPADPGLEDTSLEDGSEVDMHAPTEIVAAPQTAIATKRAEAGGAPSVPSARDVSGDPSGPSARDVSSDPSDPSAKDDSEDAPGDEPQADEAGAAEAGADEAGAELVAASEPGGFGGIPWLHLTPVLAAPLLALLLLTGGGVEATQERFGGGDPFEPNNTFAEAAPLPLGKHTGITLLRDDIDWFKVEIQPGSGLQVRYENLPDERAISLHDPSGARLERVTQSVGEVIYVPRGGKAETVYLALSGSSLERITLDVSMIDPSQRFEENDTPLAAVEVDLGRVGSVTCDGNDWFLVVVPAFHPLTAKVTGVGGSEVGLGVRLLEAAAAKKNPALEETLPTEATLAPSHLPRAVYVHVVGSGRYQLDLVKGERSAGLATSVGAELTRFEETLEPNDRPADAVRLEPGYYPNLECNGADHYRVEVPRGHSVVLEWTGNPAVRFGLRKPLFGDFLNAEGNNSRDLKRRVLYAGRLAKLDVSAVFEGRGRYALTVRLQKGPPGLFLPPGSYRDVQTRGDDLYYTIVERGQRLDLEFDIKSEERYGSTQCQIVHYNLEKNVPRGESRLNWGTTESLSGVATVTERFHKKTLVFVIVREAKRNYDLDVSIGDVKGETKATYIPPRYELICPGTFSGLTIGAGVYALDVERDQRVEAKVTFNTQLGDLDLELLDSLGETVDDSTGSEGEEQVAYVAQRTERVYLFVRDLGADAAVPFDLELKLDGKAAPVAVPTVERGLHKGLVCDKQALVGVELKQGQRLRATISFEPRTGELDLGLLDGTGREVLRATEVGPKETIDYVATTDETVYLRTWGKGERFDLELAVQDP